MRLLLILFYSFLFNILFSQEVDYKTTNKEINSFFKNISKKSSFKIGLIDKDIIEWKLSDLEHFRFSSIDSSKSYYLKDSILQYISCLEYQNILLETQHIPIDSWSSEQIKFFPYLTNQKRDKIHDKLRRNLLFYYSFSYPLFTIDKKKVFLKVDLHNGIESATFNCLFSKKNKIRKWQLVYYWNRDSIF